MAGYLRILNIILKIGIYRSVPACIHNKIKISLGDLGGLCEKGGMETCSYPPPEHMFHFESNNCTEETMVWGLAIVALQLFKINVRDFHWDRVEELYKRFNFITFIVKKVPKILEENNFNSIVINSGGYTLYNLIESMLKPNPEKRIKLIEIIEILN